MKQRQANLLVSLYNLMKDLPKDHKFNIANWMDMSKEQIHTEEQAVDCGTACCAVGWAVHMLPNWKRKFEWEARRTVWDRNTFQYDVVSKEDRQDIGHYHLGCTEDEFDRMFCQVPTHNQRVTPKDVANQIENVLFNNGYELVDV